MARQIYISGALTNSSRKKFYEAIGKVVERAGFTPYIPHLHTDPEKNPDATPEEVYNVDMMKVSQSEIIIAYVGYPSLGVGAELEHANTKNIPIILLWEKGERISRLAKGIPSVIKMMEYESEADVLNKLEEYLKNRPLRK